MEIINFGIGVFLIVVGILVYNYPYLISGYNSLTEEQKAKVDIKGLKSFMRTVLIFMGILTIVDYYILHWMGYSLIGDFVSFPIIIIGTIFMAINAGKFFNKK